MQAKRALKWLSDHEKTVVWGGIIAYALFFSAICLWKYSVYAYNGLDLAIYNQTFWNTLRGHLFQQTIHPQSYLGDHAELALLLLLPFYALAPDPRTLLVLQAVILALPAWPLYLIAKNRLAGSRASWAPAIPLLTSFAWLLNPSVQDMTLDEFHILPFAILPLLLAALAYDRGNKRKFLIWTALALLVREDVALVVVAFGLLAWLEKKDWWWRLAPVIVGGFWFVGIMKFISLFALQGKYKYLVYYAWIGGDSIPRVLLNVALHPIKVLAHLLTAGNLEMILGFGIPLLFLPFVAPRRLVLLLGPLVQILLTGPGGSAIVLMTHYAALFLPALFLASADVWQKIESIRRRHLAFEARELQLSAVLLFAVAMIYGSAVSGPTARTVVRMFAGNDRVAARLADTLVAKLPADAPVAASYRFLPQLSSRERIYSLHYLYLGVTQFAVDPYPLPADIAFTALDDDDLIAYRTQLLHTAWAAPQLTGGRERVSPLAGEAVYSAGPFTLYDNRGRWSAPDLAALTPYDGGPFVDGVLLRGVRTAVVADATSGVNLLRIDTAWSFPTIVQAQRSFDEDILTFVIRDRAGREVRKSYATLDGGIHPPLGTATEWQRTVTVPLTGLPSDRYFPELRLETQNAIYTLDGILSDIRVVKTSDSLGAAALPPFSL